MNKKKLSVIVTSYNEAKTISQVLDKVLEVPLDLDKEIIIVDGDSTDGTREILKSYGDRHGEINIIYEEKKEGKGAAIRKGFKLVTGDFVIIQDADLELDPSEYPRLLQPLSSGTTDVVYGSRFIHGQGSTPLGSYIGNQMVTGFVNLLFFKRLTDIATCYKVFKSEIIKELNLKCNGFDFDAEFTCRVLKMGKNIMEIPVTYIPRGRGEGKKLNWTAGLSTMRIIFKVRFLY